jgi:hypothetical protein
MMKLNELHFVIRPSFEDGKRVTMLLKCAEAHGGAGRRA